MNLRHLLPPIMSFAATEPQAIVAAPEFLRIAALRLDEMTQAHHGVAERSSEESGRLSSDGQKGVDAVATT